MKIFLATIPFIFLSILSQGYTQTLYKYTDKNGTVIFTDQPDKIPPEYRDQSQKRDMPKSDYKEPLPDYSKKPKSGISKAMEDVKDKFVANRGQPEVVLYTTSWCGYCKKAREHLNKLGVRYTEKDIERDMQAKRELIGYTGRTAIPFMTIDGNKVHGYNPRKVERLLGK